MSPEELRLSNFGEERVQDLAEQFRDDNGASFWDRAAYEVSILLSLIQLVMPFIILLQIGLLVVDPSLTAGGKTALNVLVLALAVILNRRLQKDAWWLEEVSKA